MGRREVAEATVGARSVPATDERPLLEGLRRAGTHCTYVYTYAFSVQYSVLVVDAFVSCSSDKTVLSWSSGEIGRPEQIRRRQSFRGASSGV